MLLDFDAEHYSQYLTEENRIRKCDRKKKKNECVLLNSVITPEELDAVLQRRN